VSQDYLESNGAPWWSPDGKQFLYDSRRGTGRRATYSYVIRSTETNQVVRELPIKLFPNGYMPDGQSLLNCCRFEGQQGAFRTDLVTGEVTPVALDSSGKSQFYSPVLSPDGKVLYFGRRYLPINKNNIGKEYAFFSRDLASGVEQELLRRPFLGSIVLSPDGKYIATPSIDPSSNSRVVLLIHTAGGDVRDVMRVAAGVESESLNVPYKGALAAPFLWRPDSSAVLVRLWHSPDDQRHELWQVPAAGAPHKLALPIDSRIRGVRLHPDGQHVSYARGEFADAVGGPANADTKQIWVLENFLPKGTK
jgi:hypothetical protein